jgi:hypothetical protein
MGLVPAYMEHRLDNTGLPNPDSGHEYWIRMRHSREGIVHLEKLMLKPAMLKMAKTLPIDLDFLKNLAKESDPGGSFKEHLLHQMAAATSKESFQNLTQLLLSLHQGVLSLPMKERGRSMLLQMRKRRQNRDLNEKSVEFYAAMHNLGPLEGIIVQTDSRRDLTLSLHYPESVALLERHIGTLEGFTTVTIKPASAPVEPFWDKERASLLDIKG